LVRRIYSGKPSCLAIVHRDASELVRLETALTEAQARKHAILESALDPIITIDQHGVITEFNRAAEQTFGHPRSEVLGTKPSEILFPPNASAEEQGRIDRYLDSGEGSMLGRRMEVTAVRASGETFPAEMAMTISHEQGAAVLTFFVRDISQRKKAEEEQARYAAELERSNRELEQFAYVASHDLQEPLRKIRTFSDRLEMKCGEVLDETGRECVQRMQDAAGRMQLLIEGLLTLSRVTTRGQDFVPVDLVGIAREVVSDLESQIDRAHGQVEIGSLPTIQADPLQMRQLLQNLIGNALKFHRVGDPPVVKVHGGYLRSRAQRRAEPTAAEQCHFIVEDNGIGFDEKYAERIFGIFQRLHPREVYEGTGIGLPICRRIVERHGGTITACSAPGHGTTFEVVLPVRHARREET
jgi:two-component system sensor kinase FixL